LRPKESLLANTRLFFGIEWETESEKPESGYKLKVGHITIFSAEGNDAVAEIKPQFFIESRARWILAMSLFKISVASFGLRKIRF
jgi:hypothetical protein